MKTRSGWVKNGKISALQESFAPSRFFLSFETGERAPAQMETAGVCSSESSVRLAPAAESTTAQEVYGRLPISFEENVGNQHAKCPICPEGAASSCS